MYVYNTCKFWRFNAPIFMQLEFHQSDESSRINVGTCHVMCRLPRQLGFKVYIHYCYTCDTCVSEKEVKLCA